MRPLRLLPLGLLALAACGDSTSPKDHAAEVAARFDRLADSLDTAGETDGSAAATGMAEAIRTSGRVGTLTVGLDGRTERFDALALNISSPSSCTEACAAEPTSGQILLAWQGTHVSEGFVVFVDSVGTRSAEVPDEATCDPVTGECTLAQQAVAVMAERIAGEEEGRVWGSRAGSVTATAPVLGGTCPQSAMVPPGAAYHCRLARFGFALDLTLAGEEGAAAGTTRALHMTAQGVPGLAIELLADPAPSGARLRGMRSLFSARPAFLVGAQAR